MRLGSENEDRRWLRNLCELARQWVEANANLRNPTSAYIDLIFAFGLARLADAEAARELLARAENTLDGKDDGAHTFLLEAFHFRITEALDGKPHTGPLPTELLDALGGMMQLLSYVVDRMRRHSRILEPDQAINPFRKWGARVSELDQQLADLTDLSARKEIVDRVQRLLKAAPKGADGNEARFKIVQAALEVAPRVGEEFAREMLDLSLPAYDALPESANISDQWERAALLEKSLSLATRFNSVGHIHQQMARFEKWLQDQRGWQPANWLEKVQALNILKVLADQCFRGLRKLGLREQMDSHLAQVADLVLRGKDLASVDADGLRVLLLVAGEWYFLGRDSQAEPVLQAAWALLLKGDLPHREQSRLACAYALAVSQAPASVAQKRLEEIFSHLKGVNDTYTTSSHFSIAQIELVETVVLGVTAHGEPLPEVVVFPTTATRTSGEP